MTIDIIRRDTLAASNTITSPLARLTAHYAHHPALALVPPLDPATSTTRPHNPHGGPPASARGTAPPTTASKGGTRHDHHC